MSQKGIEVPPYSDIQEAEDTPYDDEKCDFCNLGEDVQAALDNIKIKFFGCAALHVKCAPCPSGYIFMAATRLTDKCFNNITKEEC